MIERLLHLRFHIGVVCNSDPDSVLVNLTEEQWALLKDIVKILEPFMLAQQLMEGEKYVTLSLVPTVIERVRNNLRVASLRTDHSEYVARMLKVLTDTFTAEWGSGVPNTQYDEHKTVGYRNRHKGYRVVHMLAAFLDPRTKLLLTFGTDDRSKIIVEARRRMLLAIEPDREEQVEVPVDVPAPPARVPDKFQGLFDNLDMQISLVPPVQTAEQIVDKELLSYINTPKLERMSPCGLHVNNPLEWWAAHVREFPLLSTLARKVLCIPATSAPTERLFSYAGLTIANDRASLLPENAAEIIFLRTAWRKVEELRKRKREEGP